MVWGADIGRSGRASGRVGGVGEGGSREEV